jgi:hypothetical protein
MRQERQVFFFEKKNQKTFAPWRRHHSYPTATNATHAIAGHCEAIQSRAGDPARDPG